MAILINIKPAHECFEAIQEGMDAAKIEGKDETTNPYKPYTRNHDLWLVGFMAQKNKWVVEW